MLNLRYLTAGIFLLIFFLNTVTAQSTFQKSYGLPNLSSEALDIIEIPGGFLLAGGAVHPVTGWDGLLLQLDATGDVVWEKTYHLDGSEKFKSVVPAGDGGFVVIGEIQSSSDAWVLKVDANGEVLWQFLFDRPNGGLSVNRVLPVPGGFVLSGTTGPNNGQSSSYLARINTSGQVVWSRSYQSATNNLMTVGIVTDSLWYISGVVGLNASFLAVDPQTGDIKKAIEFAAAGTEVLSNMASTPDGNFILSDFVQPLWPVSAEYVQWVQKMSPAGTVIWSKIYQLDGQSNLNGPVVRIPSGGYLVCPGSGSNAPNVDGYLMKLDETGEVVWCHSYGNPNASDWLLKGLPTSDGGFIAAGLTAATVPGRNNVFVVKVNAAGELNGCCANNTGVNTTDFPTTVSAVTLSTGSFFPGFPSLGVTGAGNNPQQNMPCSNPSPELQRYYSLCPGETFSLNGQDFAAPDTLLANIPSSTDDCDTLATYYLLDETAGQSSNVQLQCPPDIVRTVAPGTTSVVVNYPLPTAATDCSCDALFYENLSGASSGSLFPLGNHPVCWQVKDACGSSSNCCFTITVEQEANACDSKSTSCFKWELLDRTSTSDQEVAYRIRVTNQCSQALKFAYFGVPSGILPLEPLNNSVYEPTPSRQYLVRNPNFSPFFGLRFQASTAGISGGQSDIFRMVLPKQTAPAYLYVAAKLEDGAYAEAYLNTFNCPIGQEKNSTDRDAAQAPIPARVSLSPNPFVAGKPLQITGMNLENGHIRLFNTQGTEVFQGQVYQNRVVGDTSQLPAGICFFQVFGESSVAFSGLMLVTHQ